MEIGVDKIRKISKTVLIDNKKFLLTTPTYGDVIELLQKVNDIQNENISETVKGLKINLVTVLYHIEKVDDKDVSVDEKLSILSKLQPEEVLELMKVVNSINKEKTEVIEDLKKNLS